MTFITLIVLYILSFAINLYLDTDFYVYVLIIIGLSYLLRYLVNLEKRVEIYTAFLLSFLFTVSWYLFELYNLLKLSENSAIFAFVYMLIIFVGYLMMKHINFKSFKKQEEQRFDEVENFRKAPFEITGKEKYKVESDFVGAVSAIVFLFLFIIGSFSSGFIEGLVVSGVIFLIIYFIGNLLFVFTPFYSQKKEKRNNIYKYFKTRFDLLNDFNSDEHTKIDVITKKSDKNIDKLMFDIYMEAYKKNADAIIINDSNFSSSSTQQIIASLVSYK
ncbi:hypothetical protein [Halarcobacter bivalviorum]|uniref:hypothetical protein n=1 Tax=Halarcobacter bivalviorum TaxID=663364 RepID=UPI00100C0B2B|nr:hypothetical protein [Halarcobacter bivalviorum]RXK06971.1 hypothetical protein CRU97_02365 [Halarcobacter bivalviorum]